MHTFVISLKIVKLIFLNVGHDENENSKVLETF